MKTYDAYCTECETWRVLKKKPVEGQICKHCSRLRMAKELKKINTKKQEDKVRYWHFCPHCPSVRLLTKRLNSQLCGKCTRIMCKKPKSISWFDFETMQMVNELNEREKMRYFRICSGCDDVKQVHRSNARVGLCRECSRKSKTGMKYKVKKKYQPVGTDGAKRNKVTVKFQVVDLETMEAPKREYNKKEIPQSTPEADKAMIEDYLRRVG